MRPSPVTSALLAPFLVRRLPSRCATSVLLTFDDGPVRGVTEGVLDRLADFKARALFFVLGRRVEAVPDLARAIAEGGHAVGNHSHDHDMARLPSVGAYLQDVRRCSTAIAAATGAEPRHFRAPGGRIHPASLVVPRRLGLTHVLWSLDPLDWGCTDPQVAAGLGRDLAGEARGGDIVLLHDFGPAIHPLLDQLLPGLVGRGFDLGSGLAALDQGRRA